MAKKDIAESPTLAVAPKKKKKILVAPLNWGLGHATRCIPIINALLDSGYCPVIAGDGESHLLLRQEFPTLEFITLPSYNIRYAKNRYLLNLKLVLNFFKFLKTQRAEHLAVKNLIETHQISGIISDNRFGVYSKAVPSVYITHQINVRSGFLTWLSSKLHQRIIKGFDQCWVPDYAGNPNLSGSLGHGNFHSVDIKYIGPLSRLQKHLVPIKYGLMVLLSGPEPQRQLLETELLSKLPRYPGKVLFVKGVVEMCQLRIVEGNLTIYNFMTTPFLEKSLNESDVIIARSGYTTIMDLAKLDKKAFFIPTPGQHEQKYLARKMQKNQLAPYCEQGQFTLEQLEKLKDFKGLGLPVLPTDNKNLFGLFEGK